MIQYIIKRLLIFIPTLLIISLITFSLSVMVPGDPIEQILNKGGKGDFASLSSLVAEQAYIEKRRELGLHLPVFYFGLGTASMPDSLYIIPKRSTRKTLKKLIKQYGNWPEIYAFYNANKHFYRQVNSLNTDSTNANNKINLQDNAYKISSLYHREKIEEKLRLIDEELETTPLFKTQIGSSFNVLSSSFNNMIEHPTKYKNLLPKVHFYGTNNQYHKWITKFLKGDFGRSFKDNQPVSKVLKKSASRTIGISLLSVFLSYLIAIPLGVFSAKEKGTRKEQTITTILFILYSLPSFWIATMLIMFFGGGDFLSWFPGYGLGDQEVEGASNFFEKVGIRVHHLILPLICWTYGSLAFLTRQMRGGMLTVLNQDYIRTARAKGLREKKVVWKHAFRNSLLPIITLFANVFPLMLSGSIVLELIFNIPGMGHLAIDAITARNWPVLFAVVMVSAILTLLGYLVADILYALVDPRISYNKK